MSQDDPLQEMQRRYDFERQRARERAGINAAAEAGVFDTGRPPELDLVAERDAWLEKKFLDESRPQNHMAIPVYDSDGPPSSRAPGAADHPVVVAADWDAPLQSAPAPPADDDHFGHADDDLPPATTDVGAGPEPHSPAEAEAADLGRPPERGETGPVPRMLRGLVAPPEQVGIAEPPTA